MVEKRSIELEFSGVGLKPRMHWQHAHSKLLRQVFEAYVQNLLIASDNDSPLDFDLTQGRSKIRNLCTTSEAVVAQFDMQ